MFCDASGKPVYPGNIVKTLDWNLSNDSALPAWLVAKGTSPVITYSTPATTRGAVRFQTKSSTPTSGDQAGIDTAFNLDTSKFEEIAFVVYGLVTDGDNPSSGNANNTLAIEMNSGGTQGFFYISNWTDTGTTHLRVYPAPSAGQRWDFNKISAQRRKDVGVIIRPRTKEVFICNGDPAEGAGVVAYNQGNWTDINSKPLTLAITTRTAAQRFMEFSRLKLRLVSR
jgi:hypothetical protein